MYPTFDSPDLLNWLQSNSALECDTLSFGVVGMSREGIVVSYNKAEAALSGFTPSRVVGRHFFSSVAPCTNNYLVAQRFEVEENLDTTIDYVFTFRMAPEPVHLRLLKSPDSAHMFLAVQRRRIDA